jgi:WhiB family transcriptional regulator, redox-sensing transcriptional regulator
MAVNITDAGSTTWMIEGACRTQDPELFFPISSTDASAEQVGRAVSVCHGCGVET